LLSTGTLQNRVNTTMFLRVTRQNSSEQNGTDRMVYTKKIVLNIEFWCSATECCVLARVALIHQVALFVCLTLPKVFIW